jgi:hypothetical protein
MGSNTGEVIFLVSCSGHVVVLHYTKNYCTKVVYFSKIHYRTSMYDPIASGAIVDPNSQVRLSDILALPIAGN